MPSKVLFILKRKASYAATDPASPTGLSTGLFNSANFVSDMLNENGIESVTEIARDNNDIDRLVTRHRPTHVIIEALWVIPEKFIILSKLHPAVTWIVRLHSETPFIANEGIAMKWVGQLAALPNVVISCNSKRMYDEMSFYVGVTMNWCQTEVDNKVVFLPNYYPMTRVCHPKFEKDKIDIGCFGAIRPLKNHLMQALAAIKYGDLVGVPVRFHINSGRIEGRGEPILSNLIEMFKHVEAEGHELVMHSWKNHDEFLELCSYMDIGMQVSFSETFNIVAADMLVAGVPLVMSGEIPWASKISVATPTDLNSIVEKMTLATLMPKFNVWANRRKLTKYLRTSRTLWVKYFSDGTNIENTY